MKKWCVIKKIDQQAKIKGKGLGSDKHKKPNETDGVTKQKKQSKFRTGTMKQTNKNMSLDPGRRRRGR